MNWTQDNTEGFTNEQLAIINDVQSTLEEHWQIDPQNIADKINNVWCKQDTVNDLLRDVMVPR